MIENNTSKLIGVGEDGINLIDTIKRKLNNNVDFEKIFPHQDVDKDYVRELLDGVEILFLTYNSEDKSALQIVNAIYYMAKERRVLSIGIDISKKENSNSVNIDREFKIHENNIVENFINIMLDSIDNMCTIGIDITDLKEVIAIDSGIKYTYKEFNIDNKKHEIVDKLFDSLNELGTYSENKKGIIFIEGSSKVDLYYLNDILSIIQDKLDLSYNLMFSLYLKEDLGEKINIGLVINYKVGILNSNFLIYN